MKERIIPSEIIEMPCWYYEKKNLKVTPSIKDGLSFETERRYRKEGARFIISCGTAMGLGHNTMATGVVYFHRFYMFHSFKSFPRYVTACCCLLLAGKVEETPKKCRDIIKSARSLLTDSQFFSFGEDPKEEVMTLERILLQTIKFDLQVEHPYNLLVKYAKCLKGDQTKLQKMVQMAWNFVNDSLSTTVCLQWEPEIIAVALIHLASKLSKFSVADWVGRQPHHLRWWDMFVSNVTMEILEDICHQVLDLYQHGNQETGDSSPPQKPQSRVSSPQMKRPKSPLDPPPPPQGRPPIITKPRPPETITSASQMSKPVPQPPAPDLLHYMYSSSYANMYTHGHSSQHYPPPPMPGTSMPAPAPPLPPPMYGASYLTPSESMHYTSGLPPLPSSSRIPPPQPPPPSTAPMGYYQQQSYSHGRHRFAPPQ